MDWIFFIDAIREHGYLSLCLIVAAGLFLFPVPNEVLLMSTGFLATTYLLDPIPTFIMVFLCIVFHGSFLYMMGTVFSRRKKETYSSRSIWQKRADKGKDLLNKYGVKAASFSYFFPFIRHAIPFSMGLTNVSYRLFSLVGFSSAFVWMSVYFLIGFYYGRTIKDWSSLVEQIIYTLAAIGSVVIIYYVVKRKREKARRIGRI